jgi:adenylate kinase
MAFMERKMKPQAIFFIGRPGSGKDTQAQLLMEEYGFMQVPSSQLIQKKLDANPDDPIIKQEIELNKTGELNSGPFVANVIMEFVREHVSDGAGFVFSGSPRTVAEAEVEIPEMQKVYGKDNVILLLLVLDKEEARHRILTRRLCRANKHPIHATPEFAHLKVCPQDGSELYVRELDDPKLVDTRFKAYEELTEPTIKIFEANGVPFFMIDATKTIEGIHHDIVAAIERRQSSPSRE